MSLASAQIKNALANAPFVCIGFVFGYAFNEYTHPKPSIRDTKTNKSQKMNAIKLSDGKTLQISALELGDLVTAALDDLQSLKTSKPGPNWTDSLLQILQMKQLSKLLVTITHVNVFSDEFAESASVAFNSNVSALASLKQLKYWYNFNSTQFLFCLRNLCKSTKATDISLILGQLGEESLLESKIKSEQKKLKLRHLVTSNKMTIYIDNINKLEHIDAHSIYPTSVYRRSKGLCLSSKDESCMECVMTTTISTSIVIETNVLSIENHRLRDIYAPFGRCVMVIDERVNNIYKDRFETYFGELGVELVTLAFRSFEADKHIKSVENILASLKKNSVNRNEPVLVVGGGVITDLGGLATSLYHRNTPYIMLCTSIVSGIDAGPSPRTCCDGFGYKNLYGAYHPPVLTITDRMFFKSLRVGWIRHGIAEIIKMACVKDIKLFELLERQGMKLVYSKFGTADDIKDNNDIKDADDIIKKAMRGYVESEYGNLWETHQCRPHAYGHTWSPGFELPSGMLHGHAVACGMGLGAYLSMSHNFINKSQCYRILRLISSFELSLWHESMNNFELIYKAQTRVVEKRGGNLCAPVPKGNIGKCGYINDLSKEDLFKYLSEYKELVTKGEYARNGFGVEAHCTEVGLENPLHVQTMDNKFEAQIKVLEAENEKLKQELNKIKGDSN